MSNYNNKNFLSAELSIVKDNVTNEVMINNFTRKSIINSNLLGKSLF